MENHSVLKSCMVQVCGHLWWSYEFWVAHVSSTGKCEGINRIWIMQQPWTYSCFYIISDHKICNNVLEWQSQSLDTNPIEMLLKDLKQAVRARKPTSLSWSCKEEWTKISISPIIFPSWCAQVINGYWKCLIIAAKGGHTNYWRHRFT